MKPALALMLVAFACLLSSCASAPKEDGVYANEPVTDLPWNRPQKWEGQGMMGGMSQ